MLKRTALVNGVVLESVEQRSRTGTPVIFLHGVTDSWRSFEHVLPHLPRSVRAITVSQRGHGHSSRPATYRYQDLAGDVAALMDAMHVPSAVIVGHSMGGLVAQRFAIDYPARALGLVLLGSFPTLRGHDGVQALWDGGLGSLRDPIDPAFVRAFQESTVATPIAPAMMATFVAESLKVPARVWTSLFRTFLDDDFTIELGRITAPTLVVRGELDTFSRRQERDALLAAIPGATASNYPGAGHAVHWEQPATVAADVTRFVDALRVPPAADGAN